MKVKSYLQIVTARRYIDSLESKTLGRKLKPASVDILTFQPTKLKTLFLNATSTLTTLVASSSIAFGLLPLHSLLGSSFGQLHVSPNIFVRQNAALLHWDSLATIYKQCRTNRFPLLLLAVKPCCQHSHWFSLYSTTLSLLFSLHHPSQTRHESFLTPPCIASI